MHNQFSTAKTSIFSLNVMISDIASLHMIHVKVRNMVFCSMYTLL